MKKLLILLSLALAATACQHAAPTTRVAATVPVAAAAPARKQELIVPPPAPVAGADSLTPEMRAMLRQVHIAELLLAPKPGKVGEYASVLDGFFGASPQRLSLAILKATRDSLQPSCYHIVGKARYKQQITRFEGEMQFIRVADYYDQGLLLSQGGDEFEQDTTSEDGHITNARAYSAAATFRLTSPAPATQVLTGQILLDFWVMSDGTVGEMHSPAEGIVLEKAPTKGSGLLLKGAWHDAAANSQKPFLASRDIFLLSPGIIGDFGIGDRGAEVNPKYAKYGWNTYWENDEWWADSPKVALNL